LLHFLGQDLQVLSQGFKFPPLFDQGRLDLGQALFQFGDSIQNILPLIGIGGKQLGKLLLFRANGYVRLIEFIDLGLLFFQFFFEGNFLQFGEFG